ncbi:CPBP family intramembrane glutamic endopeptidase [Bacillus weihaiensis]|uniref:CAAX prenyl protease 2/Lysostaphin resistance protein A-like domain-containing protein n=1 Tax=Bacillus weihaiensis TaxID=1547283 RepID=A0A1L3MS73_9BACI|nr:CPBP family intramembrane glutamic endopeptidase [Bacillus weihaiensis]APH05170.1 hypothetical protein A9C19_10650 [Bacillus weihaiensis]
MNAQKAKIKPMGLGRSVIFFGIPGLILYSFIYYGVPYMNSINVPLIVSFPLALYGFLGMLFFASLIGYKLEGNPNTLEGLKKRFRLQRMNWKMWLMALGTFILISLLEGLLSFTSIILASISIFSPPSILPTFIDPFIELTFPFKEFMGTPLFGNWWIICLWFICLLCNILGEEFWWRGYILPRQELVFGDKAWIVNGFLWLFLFHAFLKWNYIVLMPTCFIIPYLAQKKKSTWLAVVIHGIGNAMFFIFIIPGVFSV